MKNKAQGLSLTVIIVSAIALIILVLLVMIFTGRIGVFKEQFDPEKHECLEYIDDWGDSCYLEKPECCWGRNDTIMGYCCDSSFLLEHSKCLDWQDKTPCQLDPNAEGCICDEFGDYKEINLPNDNGITLYYTQINDIGVRTFVKTEKRPKYILKNSNDEIIGIIHENNLSEEYLNTELQIIDISEGNLLPVYIEENKKDCRSAHKPTPCELEDKNYVYDGKCYGELTDSTELCNGIPCEILCSTGWVEFCRLKKITDYSCQDLLYHILRNDCYNTKKDIWGWDCSFLVPPSNWIRTREITDIYKEKGCLE